MCTRTRAQRPLVRIPFIIVGWLATVSPAFAQSPADFPNVAVELRGGMASPTIDFTGSNKTWEPGTSASFGVNLVARPQRYLGFDVGIDAVMHAFGASGTISTTGGNRGITDREILVTLGPRLIVPSSDDRLLFSFGGGYAYVHYDEMADAQANEVITGFSGGSRSGQGAYVFGQLEYAPSAKSPVAVGFRFGTVQAKTTGTSVGRLPGNAETQDNWPTLVGTLAFRFGR
jgi:hypothetical protein